MLHVEDSRVRSLLLKGNFGLERESLRITHDGFLAQTAHPFPNHPNILCDFSENQLEINTGVSGSPQAAVSELLQLDALVQRTLAAAPEPELLWPFSNPPYIRSELDIPIAQYTGELAHKTAYREYLSDRYGRYKMAFSGIHFNYSFSDELLQASFEASGEDDFTAYKDQLYVQLAERAVAYGWLMTAVTAASPLMDSSFVEKKHMGEDLFLGLGTVRCSELGYWNYFTPVLDYSSVRAYADSIQRYVDSGLVCAPSELYYPVRIKPRGPYGLDALRAGDVSHIELRMFDLNPLYPAGVNVSDVFFAQLFLVWLASTPAEPFEEKHQVQAAQNFKNASHYDLKTVRIVSPLGTANTAAKAARHVIGFMREFYAGIGAGDEVMACLDYQFSKFVDSSNRYTHIIRERYSGGFVDKGVELARQRQQEQL
ncbi:MAG: hypothetical protein ACI36W_01000 [Coriobacteriales bacterium]